MRIVATPLEVVAYWETLLSNNLASYRVTQGMPRRVISLWIVVTALWLSFAYLRTRSKPPVVSPLEILTQRFENVPTEIDGWECESVSVPKRDIEIAHCRVDLRTFVCGKKEVHVSVKCGAARHVTMRTPDWAYSGVGFQREDAPQLLSISAGDEVARFEAANYKKKLPQSDEWIRRYWAYSDDGKWIWPQGLGAVKHHFSGRPALAAVCFTVPLTDNEAEADATLSEFAKEYLPQLTTALFPGHQ